jgi:hypothetical protein
MQSPTFIFEDFSNFFSTAFKEFHLQFRKEKIAHCLTDFLLPAEASYSFLPLSDLQRTNSGTCLAYVGAMQSLITAVRNVRGEG